MGMELKEAARIVRFVALLGKTDLPCRRPSINADGSRLCGSAVAPDWSCRKTRPEAFRHDQQRRKRAFNFVEEGRFSRKADDLRAKLTPELLVAGGVPTAHGRLILLALGADDADGAQRARAFAYQGPAQ